MFSSCVDLSFPPHPVISIAPLHHMSPSRSTTFTENITPSVKEFIVTTPSPKCCYIVFMASSLGLFFWSSSSLLVTNDTYFSTVNVIISALGCLLCFWKLNSSVTKESVMFIVSFGVQIKKFNALGRTTSVRFVPKSQIKALVINETIRKQRVVTYLALILNPTDHWERTIIPLFSDTLPRLHILELVYQQAYQILL